MKVLRWLVRHKLITITLLIFVLGIATNRQIIAYYGGLIIGLWWLYCLIRWLWGLVKRPKEHIDIEKV